MPRRERYIFADEPKRGHGFLIGFLVVLLLAVAGLFTWNFALNHTVVYEKTYVTITDLPSSLENWTILHLSDLNGASIGENQSAIKKAIGTRSYSCIVLSGNMVGEKADPQPVLDLLDILPREVPVLLLPGDSDPSLYALAAHGSLSPYADWAQRLKDAGVIILDEPVCFTRSKSNIWFIPEYLYSLDLDNTQKAYQDQLDALNALVGDLTPDQAAQKRNALYQIERMKRIRETLATITASDVQIAVTHMPLTKAYVAAAKANSKSSAVFSIHNVSLVLAGGYCGGQWRIPGVGAIWAPNLGFFPEDSLLQGLGYLNGVWQHISPGLNVNDVYPALPFRMFNSPAATMLVLTTSIH